jgi:hypothetical protein
MSRRTQRTPHGDSDAVRLQELLRADAAAVIDDDLDDDISDENVQPTDVPKVSTSHGRSQVYSIRVPVEKLEQLRVLARTKGVAPTAMLREWVLAQLDAETGNEAEAAGSELARSVGLHTSGSRQTDAVQRLEAAVATLAGVVAQLATALASSGEAALTSRVLWPPVASVQAMMAWGATRGRSGPARSDHDIIATQQHIFRGLAALRSTVENASGLPGLSDIDLDLLYRASDEELLNP